MKAKIALPLILIVALLTGVLLLPRVGVAQARRQAWPATTDEVRDAERIYAATRALEAAKGELLRRAQARLGVAGITYDPERLEWASSTPNPREVGPAGVADINTK